MDAAARQALKRAKANAEADMEINDVLLAMAQNVIEDKHAVYHVESVPDPIVVMARGEKKPPREVFYRQTVTFATRLPPPVPPKRCTCKYLCTGAAAAVKCLTCIMYDPKNLGFFCQPCFDSRHPWYRAPHVFASIEKDESVEHTLKVAHRRAEASRYEREGKDIYDNLLKMGPQLAYVGDDIKLGDNVKDIGHRTVALEAKMRQMRIELRKSIVATTSSAGGGGGVLAMSDDEASSKIGKIARGFLVRRLLSLHFVERFVKGHAEGSGRLFFYDRKTRSTSWKQPRLLLEEHLALLPLIGGGVHSHEHQDQEHWGKRGSGSGSGGSGGGGGDEEEENEEDEEEETKHEYKQTHRHQHHHHHHQGRK